MHITTSSLLSTLFALATFAAPTTSRRETNTYVGIALPLHSDPSLEDIYVKEEPCTVLETTTGDGAQAAMYEPSFACRFYT
jgi:hypothetical protein